MSQALAQSSIPLRNGELVDNQNGFAIRLDQPKMAWSIDARSAPDFVKYIGIDKERRIVYIVFVDRRRYTEATAESAQRYANGIKTGLQKGGWKVERSGVSPADIPRARSYRFVNDAINSNGVKATFVEYMTSPEKLYSVGAVLPAGTDETELTQWVRTFRLLK